jgi:hypothetical protein
MKTLLEKRTEFDLLYHAFNLWRANPSDRREFQWNDYTSLRDFVNYHAVDKDKKQTFEVLNDEAFEIIKNRILDRLNLL